MSRFESWKVSAALVVLWSSVAVLNFMVWQANGNILSLIIAVLGLLNVLVALDTK